MGWTDDIKEGLYNLCWQITEEQEREAYERICEYLNTLANERNDNYKNEGKLIMAVPVPPDISK